MKLICSILFLSTLVSAQIPQIIPTPQTIVEKNLSFKITSSTKIVIGNDDQAEQFIAQELNNELSVQKEIPLKVVDEKSVRKLTSNFIFIGKPTTEYGKKFLLGRKGKLISEMKSEGYFLDVDAKGIVIIAESDKGLFYGVMSLLQLLRIDKRSLLVSGVTIHDFPSQKIRGITDDISRGQISTMENFKKIIRFCASQKMNVYSPYIEDVFQFKRHPEIGKNRGALSTAECKELDAYAKKYFVEIIPIFETLGHWENILIHPDYEKFGEFPGAHTVNISDEKVYSMLDEMIGEIASCFSSPYFNIAADESWDVGLGVNRERVAKSDLATVHAEHYKRIFTIVKKYGKKPIMYGDIILNHPDILKKIPRDVIIVDWQYGAKFDYSSPEVFKNAGFPYIVSPAVWSFTGPFPNYLNTFLNIQNFNLDGFTNGSQGLLCSGWNDFGGEALRELHYYGYAWTAECAWNPMKADVRLFDEKYFPHFFDHKQNELRTVYTILTNPANQFHWYELWRHPMLSNREDMVWEKRLPLIQRMQSIRSSMPFVQQILNEAKGKIIKNNDHLQYLMFITKLNLWFADKIEAQEKIKLLLKDTIKTRNEIVSQCLLLCKNIIDELASVRTEFEKVWLTTNRPQGLDRLLLRYERQASYWNELAEQIQRGDSVISPQLKSLWIYHPNVQTGVKDSSQQSKAYFRKNITVPKNIRSAKVQLLGDTWTKLYVNSKFVGEVSARGSLSLMVEMERAKIFDILPFLNDSSNIVAVESQNFQEKGFAGVNIMGEIIGQDGTIQNIITDTTWIVSDAVLKGWNLPTYKADTWITAATKNYGVPVVAPNLSTNRTSWFER
ncbi:MAG: beta-N-acetylhexosaminidase [Bacteroidota bacterium]|nr:beta-N-acetylhexosaminidase [Bacteroidota bacterium]